jgi:hypothetical protein
MAGFLPGLFRARLPRPASGGTEFVQTQRPLQRLMAFTGRSIDDIVNCPIAKREVALYFKTEKWMQRRVELLELEAQWNPLGRQSS